MIDKLIREKYRVRSFLSYISLPLFADSLRFCIIKTIVLTTRNNQTLIFSLYKMIKINSPNLLVRKLTETEEKLFRAWKSPLISVPDGNISR